MDHSDYLLDLDDDYLDSALIEHIQMVTSQSFVSWVMETVTPLAEAGIEQVPEDQEMEESTLIEDANDEHECAVDDYLPTHRPAGSEQYQKESGSSVDATSETGPGPRENAKETAIVLIEYTDIELIEFIDINGKQVPDRGHRPEDENSEKGRRCDRHSAARKQSKENRSDRHSVQSVRKQRQNAVAVADFEMVGHLFGARQAHGRSTYEIGRAHV